jgi:hypothetical protein
LSSEGAEENKIKGRLARKSQKRKKILLWTNFLRVTPKFDLFQCFEKIFNIQISLAFQAILSWLSSPASRSRCPFQTAMFLQPGPGSSSERSCSSGLVLAILPRRPALAVLSCLLSSACQVLPVKFCLSSSAYQVLPVRF